MGSYNSVVITTLGQQMLTDVIGTHGSITFSKFQTSSHVYPAGTDLTALTSLQDVKQTVTPSGAGVFDAVTIYVSAAISNEGLGTGYTANTLGIFASDGNTEVLFGVATGITPDVIPADSGGAPSTYTYRMQLTVSSTSSFTISVDPGAYALSEDLQDHVDSKVASAEGVHGLRYYDDKLEYDDDGTWTEIETGGGGGSTITVNAITPAIKGNDVVISNGTESVTATMPNTGVLVFENVMMTGNLTVTCDMVSIIAEAALEVPYYGSYSVDLAVGETFTLLIDTTESTLRGKTVTISGTDYVKTGTMPESGALNIKTTYEGELTITATDGTSTATKKVTTVAGTSSYSVTLAFTLGIWGVEWTPGASSAMTRTDDAEEYVDPVPYVSGATSYSSPFDDVAPWKDIKKVTDAEGGTLVEIPKFWYKWSFGTKMKLQISDHEETGYSVAPAFMDRGDGTGERDKVYVGRYHCAASTYKSTTGVAPQASATRASFRSSISALGSKIWQWDYAMLITIQMLYLVEYADWDSQKKIGYGCGNNSSTQAMGYTDSMPYHTGTTQASRTTYGLGTQYRYIEGLWDNVCDWCDGIYFSNTDVYITKNPASFSDTSGGTLVGSRPGSSGWTSNYKKMTVSGFDWVAYPSDVAGAEGSYIGDYCNFDASGVVLFVGGFYGQLQSHGLFFLSGHLAATYQNAGIGSRLQKLP